MRPPKRDDPPARARVYFLLLVSLVLLGWAVAGCWTTRKRLVRQRAPHWR